MRLGLEGRHALVTGGSKGLGAIARELVEEGASVAICARNEAELLAAAEEIGAAHAQAADVTDLSRCAISSPARRRRSAGLTSSPSTPAARTPATSALTDENWAADYAVKVFSLIRCCREVLLHMRAAGGGRIVNIGAVYSRYPDPTFFATSVNRAAELVHEDPRTRGGEGQHPRQRRQHRLRDHAAVGEHPPAPCPDVPREQFFETFALQEVPLGRFDAGRGLGARRVPAQRPGQLHHGRVDRRRRRHGPLRLAPRAARRGRFLSTIRRFA